MQHIRSDPDHEFELVGESVAADFANTLSGSRARPSTDHVARYADLIAFAREAGVLSAADAKRLLAVAERRPQVATEIHRRSIALREAIWRAFDRIAHEREPEAADLALISAEAAEALAQGKLLRDGRGYTWGWPETDDLARPLWPIARGAVEVLTSPGERERVRECASDTCAWVFVDRTKNHSRRWCDMGGCGNRAKVRSFRERQKRVARKAR